MKISRLTGLSYSIIKSAIVSVLIFFVLTSVFDLIVWASPVPEPFLQVGFLFALSAASFFMGLYVSHHHGKKGLLTGLLAGFIPVALFCVVAIPIIGGVLEPTAYLKLALPVFAGGIGGIIGVN